MATRKHHWRPMPGAIGSEGPWRCLWCHLGKSAETKTRFRYYSQEHGINQTGKVPSCPPSADRPGEGTGE
jgi:hypothetical protein